MTTPDSYREEILDFLRDHPDKTFTASVICFCLDIELSSVEETSAILWDLLMLMRDGLVTFTTNEDFLNAREYFTRANAGNSLEWSLKNPAPNTPPIN